MTNAQLIDAYISMVEDRAAGGWEPYLLTLMFNQLRGNERAKQRAMVKECEAVDGRLLTRLVKKTSQYADSGNAILVVML